MALADDPAEQALIERAVRLARDLQHSAVALHTPQEQRQQAELDRMIQLPRDKATRSSARPWIERVEAGNDLVRGLRFADAERVAPTLAAAAARVGLYIAADSVLGIGRIELLHYLREQSLCIDYHRYGNLGMRAEEVRSSVG